MSPLYETSATSFGPRRGRASSDDGRLDVAVDLPVELGGKGEGTNPEQLFAAGYSTCFHSALARAAKTTGIRTNGAEVSARVSLVVGEEGRFGLGVVLEAWVPGLGPAATLELMEAAHEICPYSNATRGNVTVELAAAEGAQIS